MTHGRPSTPIKWYKWKLAFAWLPRKCCITGDKIWLQHAYKGTRLITGPGTPVILYNWMSSTEYLIKKIKNEI